MTNLRSHASPVQSQVSVSGRQPGSVSILDFRRPATSLFSGNIGESLEDDQDYEEDTSDDTAITLEYGPPATAPQERMYKQCTDDPEEFDLGDALEMNVV